METNTDSQEVQVQGVEGGADAMEKRENALERRVDLSVSLLDVENETEARLKRMVHKVKLSGFRPGKAPLKIVRQQYGYQTRNEVLNEAIDLAFSEMVKTQQLKVAGYPRFEAKQGSADGLFEFSAVFEVFPEFKTAELSGEKVVCVSLEVGEPEVDKTIDVLRKQRVRYEDADRPAEKGDRVVIDFAGKIDGKPFEGGQAEKYHFMLGEGTMLAGFEENIATMKVGENKSFEMVFPDDYHAKDLAGKTASFDVTVHAVQVPILPEIDAEFARMLGIADGDLVKMREEVKLNLEREVKRRLRARNKDAVMDMLLQAHPIEVPNALVDMEVQRLMQNMTEDLQMRGMAPKDLNMQPDWFVDRARRRVTLGLVVAQMVKTLELGAKPEQIKSMVEEFAQSYEDPDEVIRWYFAQRDRLAEVEALVLEENVVDWVLSNVQVENKVIVFDELMGR